MVANNVEFFSSKSYFLKYFRLCITVTVYLHSKIFCFWPREKFLFRSSLSRYKLTKWTDRRQRKTASYFHVVLYHDWRARKNWHKTDSLVTLNGVFINSTQEVNTLKRLSTPGKRLSIFPPFSWWSLGMALANNNHITWSKFQLY